MKKISFSEMRCSLARSLDVIGDWWTPLIVRDVFLGVTRFDDLAEPVDDREHGIHQRGVGHALVVPNRRKHVFSGVAQPGQPGDVEKPTAALHRVNEAEDCIEPRAIRRRRLPGYNLARQCLQRLARLGYEFL